MNARKRKPRPSPTLDVELRRLRVKLMEASRTAAKGIEVSLKRFSAIAKETERELKRLKGVGKGVLKTFQVEAKRSWNDLKRLAREQF